MVKCPSCGKDMNRWRHIRHPDCSAYKAGDTVKIVGCGEFKCGQTVVINRVEKNAVYAPVDGKPGYCNAWPIFAVRPVDYEGESCNKRPPSEEEDID